MNYRRSCAVKNGMIDGMFIFLYRMFSFKEILKKDFFSSSQDKLNLWAY